MFSLKKLRASFKMALSGTRFVWQHEQNFRIQIGMGVIVLLLMLILDVQLPEVIVLLLLIMSVLTLEILNTVVEKFIDVIEPRIHGYVRVIKDMMAAAVFLASIGSSVVGLVIFYPYLVSFLSKL